jgi:hypothetical protein
VLREYLDLRVINWQNVGSDSLKENFVKRTAPNIIRTVNQRERGQVGYK